ncbi:MAG: 5-oxoprolinase [Candidatus Schekmanbacteria bacterium RBG_13_48_7]|uniref:5-oxoprolinase n=1 Tax=Candidatus Schekmanbacteria bacterium RBG_13_48_7 TaxID=1817878 RepID=A0A1F7RVF7_9BACT|nr:MAG: 5-oxoprolinase [Candidatus Schekmanbacteria bacterium RBG_13_48_7]
MKKESLFSQPVGIEIFRNLYFSVLDAMGIVLCRSSYSTNIKERQDYSCALFDHRGRLIVQGDHLPVHLGSMALSVASAVKHCHFEDGDIVILNDPFYGGTHLPDITAIIPVFIQGGTLPYIYLANRAHHADIGGMSPGSMAPCSEIYQEGLRIPPVHLVKKGTVNEELMKLILMNVRSSGERSGDFQAQMASLREGKKRIEKIIDRYGESANSDFMENLLNYTECLTRSFIRSIPNGEYCSQDFMDDNGVSHLPVSIAVSIKIDGEEAWIDFSGTDPEQAGNINAVFSITVSAVHYVFRALMPEDTPTNEGFTRPIHVSVPEKCFLNATPPCAVAAGNVETSQRIVDACFKALSKCLQHKIPAASSGSMNNLTIGGFDSFRNRFFTYYETIGGGMGARSGINGLDGVHTHMTNTKNTPIEVLETELPLRVIRYRLRLNSGGRGKYKGGKGIRRDLQVLVPARVSILSDRRTTVPYGLDGGFPGAKGINRLIRDNDSRLLPSKCTIHAQENDIISISTPGGGGYGKASRS